LERKTKGVVCTQLKTFVVQSFGEEGSERVLARLSPADRECVAGALAIGWYDTRACLGAIAAFEQELGAGAGASIEAFGRWAAEADLTVFHRAFLRLANPAFTLEKFADYWKRFHTHGKWVIARRPDGFTATLEDFEGAQVYCRALTPYFQRAFELVGAKDVRTAHPRCRMRGDAACVWTGSWR
jgi:hypothetical protein